MRLVTRVILGSLALGIGAGMTFSCSSSSKKSGSPQPAAASGEAEGGSNGKGDGEETSTTTPIEGTRITQEPTPTPEPIRGILQGYVVDAFSDTRVDLKGKEGQFFIRIGGEKIEPKIDEDDLGYYYFQDIPINETYTVYTRFDGAQQADFVFMVKSHLPESATNEIGSTEERAKQKPVTHGNIRMFTKENFDDRDFEVRVTYKGAPVEDAVVKLMPRPDTGLPDTYAGEYLVRRLTATATSGLSGESNADGIATFKAEDISVGVIYDFEIIPPQASDLAASRGTFEMGLTDDVAGQNFRLDANLSFLNKPLAVTSCSTQDSEISAQLELVYVFNQPIEQLDRDSQAGSLAYDGLAPDEPIFIGTDQDPDDGLSDVLNVSIDGNVLRVKPKFDANGRTTTNPADDYNLRFTVTNLKIRSTLRSDNPSGFNILNLLFGTVTDNGDGTFTLANPKAAGCSNTVRYGNEPI